VVHASEIEHFIEQHNGNTGAEYGADKNIFTGCEILSGVDDHNGFVKREMVVAVHRADYP
jgi:hypothetical protein